MYKNFILIIFTFLLVKSLSSENFMMNCFNPDNKSTGFYKFIKKEKKLLSRPMKKKWTNFCDKNIIEEKNNCSFDKLKVTKISIEEDSNRILKISYMLNFKEYSLVEIKSLRNKSNNNNKVTEVIYKCRKINI